MKCIPITLSGRFVTPAILVIEIEDVFEAKIVFGSHNSSSSENIFKFYPLARKNKEGEKIKES